MAKNKKPKIKEFVKKEEEESFNEKSVRTRGTEVTYVQMARKYLEDNKLGETSSPHIAILMGVSEQLDSLADLEMNEVQFTMLSEKLRKTMANATAAIQKDVDRENSRSSTCLLYTSPSPRDS